MALNNTASNKNSWQLATIRYSLGRQQLVRQGVTVNLEPRQHRLLQTLLANLGHPVTRETLLAEVWDGRIVSDGAINRAVSTLRKAFAKLDADTDFIVTRPKLGYQLDVVAYPVEEEAEVINSSTGANKSSTVLHYIAFIIVLIGIVFVWWWRNEHGALQLGVVQPHSSFDGLESQVSTNKQGEVLLYRRVNTDGNGQIWLNHLLNNTHQPLTKPTENNQYPQLSHDGNTVAYVRLSATDCGIMLLDLNRANNNPTQLHHCPTDNIPRLSWHANSDTLFFRQRDNKTKPYQLYKLSVASGIQQQLTLLPPSYSGLGDIALAAEAEGNQLAVLRYQGATSTEVLLFDTDSGKSRHIAHLNAKANDVSWLDKTNLLISADHTLYQLDIHSGAIEAIAHSPDFINSFALTQDALYFGATEVNTSIWQKAADDIPQQLINSSRIDSLPRISTDGKQLAFLSNRQGRYQIWLRQQHVEKLLAELPGTPAFVRMDWHPNNEVLLLVKDGKAFQLDVKSGSISELIAKDSPISVANWGADGEAIIFSSQRSGDWQLWQYNLSSKNLQQLTHDGGYAGRIWQGKLYFTKFHQDGLWVKELAQDSEQLLLPNVDKINWLNWQIDQNNIYYYQPNEGIFAFNIPSGEYTLAMAEPDLFVRHFSVFNQQIYYALQHPLQGDIYRIPILSH